MKTAKGWRQLTKELPKSDLTLIDLYSYLKTVFFNRTYPKHVTVTPTYWTTEEGGEMVTIVSPMGVMITQAKNWHEVVEREASNFVDETKYIAKNKVK
jgi:hypothetical protein